MSHKIYNKNKIKSAGINTYTTALLLGTLLQHTSWYNVDSSWRQKSGLWYCTYL